LNHFHQLAVLPTLQVSFGLAALPKNQGMALVRMFDWVVLPRQASGLDRVALPRQGQCQPLVLS
jgi:hypothetical protein